MDKLTDKLADAKDKRRRELLAAAGEVFGRNGYNESTVDEIAIQAGVSKGSVYNYFGSKREIFEQLFVSGIQSDLKGLTELVRAETTATKKLDKLVTLCFQYASHHNQRGKLELEFWATAACDEPDGVFRTSIRELYGMVNQMVVNILREGEGSGEFVLEHEAEVGATLILAILDGLDVQNMLKIIELNEKHCTALKEGIFQVLTGKKTQTPDTDEPSH
jgi:AcrR family transcriptional regulator